MRLFAGIRVPAGAEIAALLSRLEGYDCLKAVEPENLHINLKFFGEVGNEAASGIKKALDTAAGFGPFDVLLSGIGAFPNPQFMRVLWIGARSERLMALHGLLDAELARLGFNIEADYKPHVTLARIRRRPPAELADLIGEGEFGKPCGEAKLLRGITESQRLSVHIAVSEISLIESVLGEKGPSYAAIHTVKL